MLLPSDSLIYLYYKCSKCQNTYDELRVSEALRGPTLTCWICGNKDKVKPIKQVKILYGKPPKHKADYSGVIKSLEYTGFSKTQIKAALVDILKRPDAPKAHSELARAVLEKLAKDEQTTTDNPKKRNRTKTRG